MFCIFLIDFPMIFLPAWIDMSESSLNKLKHEKWKLDENVKNSPTEVNRIESITQRWSRAVMENGRKTLENMSSQNVARLSIRTIWIEPGNLWKMNEFMWKLWKQDFVIHQMSLSNCYHKFFVTKSRKNIRKLSNAQTGSKNL